MLSHHSKWAQSDFEDPGMYKRAHIFLITHGKSHTWKLFCLQDINENVSGYGNYDYAYTVRISQLQLKHMFFTSKQLDQFKWS